MKNRMKRLMAIIICICMVFALLPARAIAVDTESITTTSDTQDWSGYTPISTKEELDAIRNDLTGNYYLTTDIVFSEEDFSEGGAFYNDGAGWIPVGDDFFNGFTGTFDGNGHYISGLQVNNQDSGVSGLFGYCKGTIQNLGLVDAKIYAETVDEQNVIAGTIAGILYEGTITNCYSSGMVSACQNGKEYSAIAGGLVGQIFTSQLSNCFNKATVSVTDGVTTHSLYVGGIVGHAVSDSIIESCYNTGNITADCYYGFAGGVVGFADSVTISDCYNTGVITAVCGNTDVGANAGGIAAYLDGTLNDCYNTGTIKAEGVKYASAGGIASCLKGTIEHTYNLGNVTVNNVVYTSNMGAIAGEIYSGEVVDSYFLDNLDVGVGNRTDSAIQCTENQLYNSNTFVGFDFEKTWEFAEKGNYPTLQTLKIDIVEFALGSGTEADPYHITSARELNYVRNHLAAHYILDCDIVFTDEDFAEGGPFYNDGSGWIPIGAETTISFTGVFDGNNHIIEGLHLNISSDNTIYAGLFAQCDGTIKDVGLVDNELSINTTSATIYGGSLVGYAKNCTIDNCYMTGSVTVSAEYPFAYVGGIVGNLWNGTVVNCYNEGTVSIECQGILSKVGAIVGSMSSGTIDNCSNYGYALGGYNTGGVVGTIYSGTIKNCKNMDTISGSADTAGGIVGSTSGDDITVSACYNTAYVCATRYAGGIVGYQSGGDIIDCMNLGRASAENLSNSNIYAGGLTGYVSSGTISNSYSIGEVVSWGYYAGGIAGRAPSSTITNCYYKDTMNKGVASGTDAGTKCTDVQMQMQNTFVGFDFDKVWRMGNTKAFPYPELKSNSNLYGSIPISTKEELNAIRNDLDENYYLTTDIVFTEADFSEGGVFYNNGTGWLPIGSSSSKPFAGRFDGNGHTISNLVINVTESLEVYDATIGMYRILNDWGLFGYCSGSSVEITNLGLENVYISIQSSNANVGSVAGYFNGGAVTKCYCTGTIIGTGSNSQTGGIVGYATCKIQNCFNESDVHGSKYVGGIVGNLSGEITHSNNVGDIIGENYAGGIVGRGDECVTTLCYNTGTIIAQKSYAYAGGIIGESYNGEIQKCYNTGAIAAKSTGSNPANAGGIIGSAGYVLNDCSCRIIDCYNTGKVTGSGQFIYVGGVVGSISKGSVENCYNVGCPQTSGSANQSFNGGIAGYTDSAIRITNCYYLNNANQGVGYGIDDTNCCTDAKLQQKETYVNFDFDSAWTMEGDSEYSYPEIIGNEMNLILMSIELEKKPSKTEYIERKDTLDVQEGVVVLNFTSNIKKQIPLTTDMVSGFNNKNVGTQTLTVTYKEKTCTYDVEIVAKSIESIAVTKQPTKLTYLEGKDTIRVTGGKITVYYNNDTSKVITITEDMVSGFDNTIVGKQTLTVTYEGKTCTYDVEIIAKSLTMVDVTQLPSKKQYLEGMESLDVTGGKITVYYNNGSKEEIDITEDMVSGFDNTIVGLQTLTVTYGGKTDTYSVRVIAKSLDSIAVTTQPAKLSYLEGKETLDVTGGKITAYYNNGSKEEIDITADMVAGFNNSVIGEQTLTVTYNRKTCTYKVAVVAKNLESIALTTQPSKLTYLEGKEHIDVTDGKITLYYNNGRSEEIDITAEMVTGFNNTVVGKQEITVTYEGKKCTYSVEVIAKTLESIAVTTLPTKLSYLEGKDTLNATGGKITLYYNNGNTEEINITTDMVSGFNNAVVGKQALTVTYGDKSCTYNVEIVKKSLVSIAVTRMPFKTSYLEGKDALEINGGQITLYYNNDSSEVLNLTVDMVSGFNNANVGKQTLTVTYEEKTCSYDVEIIGKTLKSIAVSSKPSKLTYLEGKDTLDISGGKITLYYNNNTSEEVVISADMVSGFNNTVVGKQTLTVTYDGKTGTYDVEVIAKSLESVTLTTVPTKCTYLESKDILDVSGGTLTLHYNNDTSEQIDITAEMVSGFNNTIVGIQTLIVTYKGKTCNYNVEIIEKSLDNIAVTTLPSKLTYLEGKDAIDVMGGKITLYYNNDTFAEIDMTAEMISNFDNYVVGEQTLTVTYNGKSCNFSIEIIEKSLDGIAVTTLPSKLTYLEGRDALDVFGGTITLYYNNDTYEEIDITPEMVSGFDNTIVGRQTLTVTYNGKSCNFYVEIVEKSLDSIAVTTLPNKLTYLEGKDVLDLTGGKITLHYNNDSHKEIDLTSDMISGFDNSVVGEQILTVTYNGKECDCIVEIVAKQLVSIAVSRQPKQSFCLQNEEALDVTEGKIMLYYNNDFFEEIDMTTDMITGFDNTVLGKQTLTVEYGGFTAIYQVEIISGDSPQIIVLGGVGTKGGVVTVAISLKNNPGIASMTLDVDYDSAVMKLVGVTDLGKLGASLHSNKYSDPYVLCWANDTATQDFVVDGEVVILTFEISDMAELGEYSISVSYDYEKHDIYNTKVEDVKFYTVAGSIEIVDVLIGDVNNDGSVDNLDRLVLSRYLANWQDYTIDQINPVGADVNCDGSIDNLDRLILSRHLANWSGYEELPLNSI